MWLQGWLNAFRNMIPLECICLRVPQRIEFKVLTLVFKRVNNLAPEYLQDFLVVSRNTTLQSANTKKIHMVKFRTQKLLNCSFTYAVAKLWNDLPISLKESVRTMMLLRLNSNHTFLNIHIKNSYTNFINFKPY